MPKAAGSNAERLSALIAGIEANAYERGRADARKELLDLCNREAGGPARAKAGPRLA